MVSKDRGTPQDAYNGNSKCIQRYHSVTSEQDQVTQVDDFGKQKFPMLSSTSALGLGQNWTMVRLVVVMGAMDPAESNQMGGRAGRGGNEGVVILLVQPTMTKGKNLLEAINVTVNMDNQE